MYGRLPKHALDLVDFPKPPDKSIVAENMVNRIKAMHADIKKQLEESNASYMADADTKKRMKLFQEGDLVIVYLRRERFPAGTYKLQQIKEQKVCPLSDTQEDQ